MKFTHAALLAWVGGAFCLGTASAQQLNPPYTANANNYSYYQPKGDDIPSPSDIKPKPAPKPMDMPAAPAPAAEEEAKPEVDESSCEKKDGCDSKHEACPSPFAHLLPCCRCEGEEAWTLFPQDGCVKVYGWLAQGFYHNPRNPVNPSAGLGNLPLSFVQRNDEYILNQLYGVVEKTTEADDCSWDIGGRIDLLYGEDYIWTQAAGLETRQNFTNHWNTPVGGSGVLGTGRLGLAMPQAYVELAHADVKVKVGHFYTPAGYEVVPANGNFFYSHVYTHQWGEPFTHTGALATWAPSEEFSYMFGVVNGWDKFDAMTDRASYLFGATTKCNEGKTSLAFVLVTGEEDGALLGTADQGHRTYYSVVFSHQATDNLQWVVEHDNGWQDNALASTGPIGRQAQWYSVTNYLIYKINDCWKAGVRHEWMNDQNGTRVGTNNPYLTVAGVPRFAGHYQDITAGLNWSPKPNIIIRPEVRWDWFDAHTGAGIPAGRGPFNSATGIANRNDQFTTGVDVIFTF